MGRYEDNILEIIKKARETGELGDSVIFGTTSYEDFAEGELSYKLGEQAYMLEQQVRESDEHIQKYLSFAASKLGMLSILKEFANCAINMEHIGFQLNTYGSYKEYAELFYATDIQACGREFVEFVVSRYEKPYRESLDVDLHALDSATVDFLMDYDKAEGLYRILGALSKTTSESVYNTIVDSARSRFRELIKEHMVEHQLPSRVEAVMMPKVHISLDPFFFYHMLQKLEYYRFAAAFGNKNEKIGAICAQLSEVARKSSGLIDYYLHSKLYRGGIKRYVIDKAVQMKVEDSLRCIELKKTLLYLRMACKNPESMLIFIDEARTEVSFAEATKDASSIGFFKACKGSREPHAVDDVFMQGNRLIFNMALRKDANVKITFGKDMVQYRKYFEKQDEFNMYIVDMNSKCLEYEVVRFKLSHDQKLTILEFLGSELAPAQPLVQHHNLSDEHVVGAITSLLKEYFEPEKKNDEIYDYIEKRYSIGTIDTSDIKLMREIYEYISRRYYIELLDGGISTSKIH